MGAATKNPIASVLHQSGESRASNGTIVKLENNLESNRPISLAALDQYVDNLYGMLPLLDKHGPGAEQITYNFTEDQPFVYQCVHEGGISLPGVCIVSAQNEEQAITRTCKVLLDGTNSSICEAIPLYLGDDDANPNPDCSDVPMLMEYNPVLDLSINDSMAACSAIRQFDWPELNEARP